MQSAVLAMIDTCLFCLSDVVELSTAVVKVDTKVTNASLTQNQCLQCVPPSLTHVETL